MSALTACIGAEQWQHALVLWETLEAGDRVLVLPMCYLAFCKTAKTRKSVFFCEKNRRLLFQIAVITNMQFI